MNTEDYRYLTGKEKAILDKLLEHDFPERDKIYSQISLARVKIIKEYTDNYGSIEFLVPPEAPVSQLERFIIEGLAKDKDGVPIEFILHIMYGKVKELEIVKADGSPIKIYPNAVDIEVKSI